MTDDLMIRAAVNADIPQLADLYNHYILTSAATFDTEPHTVSAKREWFSTYSDSGAYRVMVAVDTDGQTVGHASSSAPYPTSAYDNSLPTSVYLLPGEVGRGVGTRLWYALYDELAKVEELHQLFALITLPNDASIAMTEKVGYTLSGVWKECGRKFNQYWDVGIWQRPMRPIDGAARQDQTS